VQTFKVDVIISEFLERSISFSEVEYGSRSRVRALKSIKPCFYLSGCELGELEEAKVRIDHWRLRGPDSEGVLRLRLVSELVEGGFTVD